jgi:16S rRNA (cytosine967-C5)-methyltransferase
MRLPPAILGNTEEVLREILRFTAPADVTLSRYFKDHPRLGGRERGAIAECVYAVLRNKTFYTDFTGGGRGATMRRLVLLGMAETVGIDALGGLSDDETALLERIKDIDRSLLPARQRANLPDWLYDKFVAQYGEEETLELAKVLNTPAPLDLRVNTLKADREKVVAELATAPIAAEPTPYSATGLRILKKPAIQNLPLFKEARSKSRTRAARCWPSCWVRAVARWWSTFAPAPAARPWPSAPSCAIPAACMPSTSRKNAWPS